MEQTASSGLDLYSEEEIAQQLTIVDFNIYTNIKPVELLNQAWNKVCPGLLRYSSLTFCIRNHLNTEHQTSW